jgi:phosphohistidine phosphatase SixA
VLRSPAGAASVLVFRHALAPGTFDPPGFKLGDCSSQRNLNDAGRAQARQIGEWFAQRRLRPQRVRSSPWCRCTETARLAFGDKVDVWAALGSPRAGTEEVNAQSLTQLKAELRQSARRAVGFEVWVTHMFVISALVNEPVRSGEALLLGVNGDGSPRVVVRFSDLAV